MPYAVWSQNLSIGVEAMDEQHKRLLELLNQLHDSLETGDNHETLAGVLDGLAQYTQVHFSAEEELMSQHGYPDLPAHREQHQKLTAHLLWLTGRFRGGEADLAREALRFVKRWLCIHIVGSDKQYGNFLKNLRFIGSL